MYKTSQSLYRFANLTIINIFNNNSIAQYTPMDQSKVKEFLEETLSEKYQWQKIQKQKQNNIIKGFIQKLAQSTQVAELLSSSTGKQMSECQKQFNASIAIMKNHFQETKPEDSYPNYNAYRFHPFDFSTSIFDHRHPVLAACSNIVLSCRTNTPLLLRPSPKVIAPIAQIQSIWNQLSQVKLIRCLVDSEVSPSHDKSVVRELLKQTEGFMSFWGRVSDGLDFHYYTSRMNQVFRQNQFMLTSSDTAYVMKDLAPSQLKKAASVIARASFSNCGHNFNSIKRVFVDREIFDQMLELLYQQARRYGVGSNLYKTDNQNLVNGGKLAPFILPEQYEESVKMLEQLRTKHNKEFKCLKGGDCITIQTSAESKISFIEPTIFRVEEEFPSFAYQNQEYMMPVMFVQAVDSVQACIQKINSSIFGATTTLFTTKTDIETIEKLGSQIEVGTVNVNSWDISAGICYSGRKRSGKGFSLSPLSINNLTRSKSVSYS